MGFKITDQIQHHPSERPNYPSHLKLIFVGFFGTYFGKKILISKGKHYFQKVLTIILLLGGIRIIHLGLQNLNLL